MNIKFIKKGDFIVIAVIAAAVIILSLLGAADKSKPIAEISVNGEIVHTLDLRSVTERVEIAPNDEYNILIVAENGSIRFEHSDCEDKLCVSSGNLSKSGDIAVCLPAKTVVTVSGSDVGVMTY
jgi:hypothetical protein